MARDLNVLVVEDSESDSRLIVHQLTKAGFDPHWQRIESEQEYRSSLTENLQLIISDYTLPQFDPQKALNILQESGLDIPFIVVSGTIGEERAVEILKAGATDCLLKERLNRIGPAVERALREAALRAGQRRLEQELRLQAAALEAAANAIAITDPNGAYLWVNKAFTDMTGYAKDEVIGHNPRLLKSGAQGEPFYEDLWRTIAAGKTWHGEFANRRKNGALYFGEQTITPVTDSAGRISHFVGIMNDVSARKCAEEELRVTHERLRSLLAHNPAVFYALAIEGESFRPFLVSETIFDLLGFSVQESSQDDWWGQNVHPSDREAATAHNLKTIRHGHSRAEFRVRHKNGTYKWIEDSQKLVRSSHGQPIEIAGVWMDITARKKLEHEIQVKEQRLKAFFASAAAGLAIIDREHRFIQVNDTLAQMNGVASSDHTGRLFGEVLPHFAPTVLPLLGRVFRTGEPIVAIELFGEVAGSPGTVRHWLASYFPMKGVDGTVETIGAIVVEQTERKRAEAALKFSEEKFRQLAETINDVFWMTNGEMSEFVYVSPAFERLWGKPVSTVYDDPKAWFQSIVPEDQKEVIKSFEALIRGAPAIHVEYRIRASDGSLRWISDRGFSIKDESGTVYRHAGVAADITEKKKLEAQLLRAQRMESIGTLAGGIAHDLNNALSPILMAIQILEMDVVNPEGKQMLEILSGSAQRGADMVKQLLTFSRGVEGSRGIIELKHLIREMQTIVRQTFPKNIQARTDLPPDTWAVIGDATQLHQVLLNLCVNARDAMPNGGMLTIKTKNITIDEHFTGMRIDAKPGPYVMLSVTDTGTGMPPEVQERIFEPFFTTKPIDKGTGLGLSTVSGIVKSHGGFVSVYSEVGKGTEFHIYIPASPVPSTRRDKEQQVELPTGKGELIVVVDDEQAIRHLTQKTLETFGYRVVTAPDGAQAVALCAQHLREVALVLTDVAMPIMDGYATIRAVRSLDPKLKIIAASGLHDEGKGTSARALGADAFIHKPFTAESLLGLIREVLDR